MPVHVLQNAVLLSHDHRKSAQTFARRHARRIFNPDQKRRQVQLTQGHAIVKAVTRALGKNGFLYGRCPGESVLIHSKPGCRRQQWHTDYDSSAVRTLRKKPLGVLVALMPDTVFETPFRRFVMQEGDMIVFDGDEVHAGAAYSQENTRFHMYLDSPTHTRQHNKTYLAKPH